MADTAQKLDMELDDLVTDRGNGGKAPRGGRRGRGGEAREGGARDEPYRNTGGRRHLKGATLQDIAAAPESERVVKVSAKTEAKTIAGAICHITREAGGAPALLPLGASCINQAVKGIAIARRYLSEEGLDLTCQPDFRDDSRKTVVLKLTSLPFNAPGAVDNEVVLTVASGSQSHVVAGAIAGKVREEQPVCVKALGAETVAKSVYAIAHARQYLSKEGLDICCLPEFIKEQKGADQVSVMKFTIAITEAANKE